jgi:hypothetical protein
MRAIRQRLTYANVIATLSLFLVLGGGAYAATRLPKNSVGTNQLKNGAVTAGKIAKKTRQQLQGARGPAGAQGPPGKTGTKGSTGAKGSTGTAGVKGVAGADGTGPVTEIATKPATPIAFTSAVQVVAIPLSGSAYATSANVVVGSVGGAVVSCTLTGGGEATATVSAGGFETLALSAARGAGSAAVICSAAGGTAELNYASVTAIQTKSQSRTQS